VVEKSRRMELGKNDNHEIPNTRKGKRRKYYMNGQDEQDGGRIEIQPAEKSNGHSEAVVFGGIGMEPLECGGHDGIGGYIAQTGERLWVGALGFHAGNTGQGVL
jgi:hypothetical protein